MVAANELLSRNVWALSASGWKQIGRVAGVRYFEESGLYIRMVAM